MDIGKELPITPGTIVFDVPSVAMVIGQRPSSESSECIKLHGGWIGVVRTPKCLKASIVSRHIR